MAEPNTPVLSLSRRSLLGYTALTAGLLTLSRLRLATAEASTSTVAAPGLQVLTAKDAAVMTAIAERIVFTGDRSMPKFHDTHGIETIDQAVLQLDPSIQGQMRWLLWAFEYGPPVLAFKLTTFTAMAPEEQDIYLRGWATGGDTRRLAFRAIKNLSMLGYYSQDGTWKGIHYGGPWAPRPRRVIRDD